MASANPDVIAVDDRLPYEPPELVDYGDMGEVTLSNGNNSGSDGGYS